MHKLNDAAPSSSFGGNSKQATPIPCDAYDFETPAKDDSGESVICQCRVPPEAARMLQIIREQLGQQYKTTSDIVRRAVFYFLANHPHGVRIRQTREYKAMVHLAQINREHKRIADVEERIGKVHEHISYSTSHGMMSSAGKAVSDLLLVIDGLEDVQWREHYRERVVGEHGHLLGEGVMGFAMGMGDNGDRARGDNNEDEEDDNDPEEQ